MTRGGLELLFDNVTKHSVTFTSSATDTTPTIAYLITYICDNLMKDPRKEMFVLDGTIRPGILVLINDADWELEGEDKYELKEADNVLFVSTLHGG
jgi:ubiquitin related modifier 1